VELAIEEPAWGQVRAANQLKKKGITISAAGSALCLAASRSADDEKAAQTPGDQELTESAGVDRNSRGIRK
jgi:hypothetical protein